MIKQSRLDNSEEAAFSLAGSSTGTSSDDAYQLPSSFGEKKIVVINEESALVTGFGGSNVLTSGASINVSGSTNVGFGDVINLYGNVTMYTNGVKLPEILNDGANQDEVQYKGKVEVIDVPNKARTTSTEAYKKRKGRRKIYLLISSIITIILIALAAAFLIVFQPSEKDNFNRTETSITVTTVSTTTPVPGSDEDVYVTRDKWEAKEPVNSITIPAATLVVVKHTGGPQCTEIESCKARVKEMQKEHMEVQKFPDISYNFLIGGDGKIYIGRGFHVKNEGINDSMDIAFIGNYSIDIPTAEMLHLGNRVIIKASTPRVEAVNFATYHVVNHNQTERTESPGKNLFDAVTKWDEYSPDIYFNDSSVNNYT